jgi:hypothetical protein
MSLIEALVQFECKQNAFLSSYICKIWAIYNASTQQTLSREILTVITPTPPYSHLVVAPRTIEAQLLINKNNVTNFIGFLLKTVSKLYQFEIIMQKILPNLLLRNIGDYIGDFRCQCERNLSKSIGWTNAVAFIPSSSHTISNVVQCKSIVSFL